MAESTIRAGQIEFVETSDVASAVEAMLEQAVAYSAAKTGVAGREAVVKALGKGDSIWKGHTRKSPQAPNTSSRRPPVSASGKQSWPSSTRSQNDCAWMSVPTRSCAGRSVS